ncbi:aminotransferase class IV [Nocardioides pacificus]
MRAWVNGRLLEDPDEPAVAVTDRGFSTGDGVLESLKLLDGVPFALTRHLDRLAQSARGLGLDGLDLDVVRRGVADVVAGQDWALGRMRITVSRGIAPLAALAGTGRLTVAVVADEMAPQPATTAVATVPWVRNERGPLTGLKTTSYAENVVALAHARKAGAGEAVFANTRGELCEGTATNVFYVVDGELRTPSVAGGCLPGVTRALVLEWYGAREVDEPIDVIDRASEVFLVSTTRDVQAVHAWDGRELPAPGPVTRAVAEVWRAREEVDLDP